MTPTKMLAFLALLAVSWASATATIFPQVIPTPASFAAINDPCMQYFLLQQLFTAIGSPFPSSFQEQQQAFPLLGSPLLQHQQCALQCAALSQITQQQQIAAQFPFISNPVMAAAVQFPCMSSPVATALQVPFLINPMAAAVLNPLAAATQSLYPFNPLAQSSYLFNPLAQSSNLFNPVAAAMQVPFLSNPMVAGIQVPYAFNPFTINY